MSVSVPSLRRLLTLTLCTVLCTAVMFAFTDHTHAWPKGGNGGGNGNGGGEDPPPPLTFSVAVLGGVPGRQTARLNDQGDVVGTAIDAGGGKFAAIWPAGSTAPLDLNTLIDPDMGVTLLRGSAINNVGQVAGWMARRWTDETGNHITWSAYRLTLDDPDPPIFEDLGAPPFNLVQDMNDWGDVVVLIPYTTYVYTDELGLVSLDIGNYQALNGNSINNSGEIVGEAKGPSGYWHAFLYSPGDGTWQNLAPSNSNSGGLDINEAGEIVGYSYQTSGKTSGTHAALWSPDTGYEDLGTLGGTTSKAYSINDSGLIVGTSTAYKPRPNDPPAPSVAFLLTNGTMHELLADVSNGGLLADGQLPAGWDQAVSSTAYDINDANQIVGWVDFPDGTYELFVLTPIAP